MAFLHIPNVKLTGISACIPKKAVDNIDYQGFSGNESLKFMESTGVERHRKAEDNICASDLCYYASEQLIQDLHWNREDIDCLIFVTQTPDYILPATSCILQQRLRLNEGTIVLDISLGCSGWVYGLQVISSMLHAGQLKKGLLLVGDTIQRTCSVNDKSTLPLFGDGGAATAIEFCEESEGFKFHLAVDGSGYNAIIIPDGGYRNETTCDSLRLETIEPGIERNKLHLILNGMDVFSFGITKAPESIRLLSEEYAIDLNKVDFFIFHQANLFMNEKIRKKLKIPEEKVPYTLKEYGNTSSASIPLTMVSEINKQLEQKSLKILACGFGVGLSWGTVYLSTDRIVVADIIEI